MQQRYGDRVSLAHAFELKSHVVNCWGQVFPGGTDEVQFCF